MSRLPQGDGRVVPHHSHVAPRGPVLVETAAEAPHVGNDILNRLPAGERGRLLGLLQPTTLNLGDVLWDAGERIERVYFPVTAVVSALHTTEDGATVEMGLAGRDGVVGISTCLGADIAAARAVSVVGGSAFTMRARALRDEFAGGGTMQELLLRYTQALLTQISQTAVCNRLHGAEQRLGRWLLMCRDRVESNDLHMTQEFIAHMLGGRRETVTVAAGRLQDAGLIRYSRGHITILDRRGLEGTVCECYAVVESLCGRPVRASRHHATTAP